MIPSEQIRKHIVEDTCERLLDLSSNNLVRTEYVKMMRDDKLRSSSTYNDNINEFVHDIIKKHTNAVVAESLLWAINLIEDEFNLMPLDAVTIIREHIEKLKDGN